MKRASYRLAIVCLASYDTNAGNTSLVAYLFGVKIGRVKRDVKRLRERARRERKAAKAAKRAQP